MTLPALTKSYLHRFVPFPSAASACSAALCKATARSAAAATAAVATAAATVFGALVSTFSRRRFKWRRKT